MLLIPCPWCGARDETEFHCGGEAHIARPKQPHALSDDQWADYLFMRGNPKGLHFERWRHVHGCGRWFNVVRDTVSDQILEVYPMGAPRPRIEVPAATGRSGARRDLTVVASAIDETS
jgi:sarcosine oxidase subunit delta